MHTMTVFFMHRPLDITILVFNDIITQLQTQ